MNKKLKEELENIFHIEQYGHPPQTRPVATRSIGVKPSDDDGDSLTVRDEDNKKDIQILG